MMIEVADLRKTFRLHQQQGVAIPALRGIGLTVAQGECLALRGPSGSGKSTLLRSIYANYKPDSGRIANVLVLVLRDRAQRQPDQTSASIGQR